MMMMIDTMRQQIQLRVRYRWRHRATVESLEHTEITPRQHDTERNFRSSNNVPSPSLPSPSRGRGKGSARIPDIRLSADNDGRTAVVARRCSPIANIQIPNSSFPTEIGESCGVNDN